MSKKFIVVVVCCVLVSFSASAQWSVFKRLPVFNKHQRVAELSPAKRVAFKMPVAKLRLPKKLQVCTVAPSDYWLELAEADVMKTAQHNMRFRVYTTASYNFNSLAHLYMLQNRFSEAKWFFLQSNIISREQNNGRLIIANLLQLGTIKAEIGDFVLAQQDLLEARDIASSRGYLNELLQVEKALTNIQRNRFVSVRTDLRYDDALKAVPIAN